MNKLKKLRRNGTSSIELVLSLVIFSVLSVIVIQLYTGLNSLKKDNLFMEVAENLFINTNETFYSYDNTNELKQDSFLQDYTVVENGNDLYFTKKYNEYGYEFHHNISLKHKNTNGFKMFLNLQPESYNNTISKEFCTIYNNLYNLENKIIVGKMEFLVSNTSVKFINKDDKVIRIKQESVFEENLDDVQ